MDLVLPIAIGLAVGGGAVWTYLRQESRGAFERGRISMDAERAALIERIAARDSEVARLQSEMSDLETQRNAANELRTQNARLAAELDAERASAREKLAVLNEAQEQLTSAFRGLSGAGAAGEQPDRFSTSRRRRLANTSRARRAISNAGSRRLPELVAPVKLSLDKLDGRIHDIEKLREGAYQALTTQVRSLNEGQGDLRRETLNLVKALRQPAARGRWGELQLRRVVEMAGMVEHCDFVEQASVTGEDGRQRPDVVVRLPGGLNIVDRCEDATLRLSRGRGDRR